MWYRRRCLDDGALRALAEGEVAEPSRGAWQAHLEVCPGCRARLERVRADREAADRLMARILPEGDPPDVERALRALRSRRQARAGAFTEEGVWPMGAIQRLRWRGAALGAVVAALMVATILVAPVGTLADNMLNKFRVQQFAAITIPMDFAQQMGAQLPQLSGQQHQELAQALQGLGTFQTTFSPSSLHEAASVDEARSHLGGTLAVPSKLPGAFQGVQPKIYLGDAGRASYTLDVAKAQQMLRSIGVSAAFLPDPRTTPSATITLDVPASAAFVYAAGDKHLVVGQMASPTLDLGTIDAETLRETLLALPGLPPDLVAQIRNVRDWRNTLIIPVPAGAKTSQKTVDGVPALLIESSEGAAVLWQKDGNLHVVAGQATADEVMATATALR